jgi:hypothetical protein
VSPPLVRSSPRYACTQAMILQGKISLTVQVTGRNLSLSLGMWKTSYYSLPLCVILGMATGPRPERYITTVYLFTVFAYSESSTCLLLHCMSNHNGTSRFCSHTVGYHYWLNVSTCKLTFILRNCGLRIDSILWILPSTWPGFISDWTSDVWPLTSPQWAPVSRLLFPLSPSFL